MTGLFLCRAALQSGTVPSLGPSPAEQSPDSRRCRFSGNAPVLPTCSLPGLSPPAAQDTAFLSVSLFKAARKSRQQTCHRIEKAAMFRPSTNLSQKENSGTTLKKPVFHPCPVTQTENRSCLGVACSRLPWRLTGIGLPYRHHAFTLMDRTSSFISSGYSLTSLSVIKSRRCWKRSFSVAINPSRFGTVRGLYLS